MTRQQRNSILCPKCNRLVSADEARCPHCGTRRPGSIWKNNFLTRNLVRSDRLIRTVVIANVGMFLLSLFFNSRLPGMTLNPLLLLSPESRSLLDLGATGVGPIAALGRPWSIVSAMYLHGGLLHLLFNMVAFSQLAPLVIREYGVYRTMAVYTIGGAAGFWISYRAGVTFTIGASGAVCALIGAILYYGLSRGGIYGKALFQQVGAWALGILFIGFLIPNINNWAHGGGLLAGMALGFFLGYKERRRETAADRIVGGGCALATVLVLAWAVMTGILSRLPVA